MENNRERERRWNQKVSRNNFADPKPWQNGKQRRHGVGTRERGDEIKREAMNIRRKKQKKREVMKTRRKKQKKREAILGHGERRERFSVSLTKIRVKVPSAHKQYLRWVLFFLWFFLGKLDLLYAFNFFNWVLDLDSKIRAKESRF